MANQSKHIKEVFLLFLKLGCIAFGGPAAFIGVGMIVFKYGYVYVGYLDLIKKSLPSRQYFDVVVGVTF